MAKIRTTPEEEVTGSQDIQTTEVENQSPTQAIEKKKGKEAPTQQTSDQPDKHVIEILKIYSRHKELYVDKYGGVFTPDTPSGIRKNAVKYQNPFYQS